MRPLLIDKLSSIPIPQDGAIAAEGFVLLPIVDPFINIRINYQYDDQLLLNEGGSQRRHVEKYELIDCYKS